MRTWISLLGGLLVCQLVLIVVVDRDSLDPRVVEAKQALLPVVTDKVDRIELDDGDKTVNLIRKSDKWQIPQLDGFPADGARVEQLLERLQGLRRGWPVADSDAAAGRFKVGDKGYERRVSLWQGAKKLPILLIGSSPGYRKVHVRRDGEQEIYSVSFNAYEVGVQADDWIDRTVLSVDENEISEVHWPNFGVRRDGKLYQLEGLKPGQVTAEEPVQSLVSKLANLPIQSVVTEKAPDQSSQAAAVEIELKMTNDKTLHYKFIKAAKKQDFYYVQRSDLPYRLKVAAFDAKPLVEAKRETLVQAVQDKTAEPKTAVSQAPRTNNKDGGTELNRSN